MKRTDAYAILTTELQSLSQLNYSALVKHIGQPPTAKSVTAGLEEISVRVQVSWADSKRRSVRVEATADGPSPWRLERLVESVTVSPPN
jgi:hypothetical protein